MIQPEAKLERDRARFAQRTSIGPTPQHRSDLGHCLLFDGADNGRGYAQFHYGEGRRNGYAHRFAWESPVGPIPQGMTIDHLCRVRNCVRLSHLEVVDGPTNTRRGAATKPSCKNGHPRTTENIYITPAGRRTCRICRRDRSREHSERLAKGTGHWTLYDQDRLRSAIAEVLAGDLSVRQAAEQIGCATKYMDKRVRDARRSGGDFTAYNRIGPQVERRCLGLLWAGVSKNQAGRLCGVSPTTVTSLERRADDATKHWPFSRD